MESVDLIRLWWISSLLWVLFFWGFWTLECNYVVLQGTVVHFEWLNFFLIGNDTKIY